MSNQSLCDLTNSDILKKMKELKFNENIINKFKGNLTFAFLTRSSKRLHIFIFIASIDFCDTLSLYFKSIKKIE